jgi:hypothetical protein
VLTDVVKAFRDQYHPTVVAAMAGTLAVFPRDQRPGDPVTGPATDLSGRLDASLRTISAITRASAVVLAAVVGGETAVAYHGDSAPDVHIREHRGAAA